MYNKERANDHSKLYLFAEIIEEHERYK